MRLIRLVAGVALLAGIALADSAPSSFCPSTVTSCAITLGPGTSVGYYDVSFQQNPTPFWEGPVSGWPPEFRLFVPPSDLASGTVPYNIEYDFIVGTEIPYQPGNSAQVTVSFQLPPSITNWVVLGYPDVDGGNNATLLTADGGPTGAGVFASGTGSVFELTAVPGELIVSTESNPGNVGDTEFVGMLIGETTVPEPRTGWLVLAGVLIAIGARLTRRQHAL
jgi:hypothetical protein